MNSLELCAKESIKQCTAQWTSVPFSKKPNGHQFFSADKTCTRAANASIPRESMPFNWPIVSNFIKHNRSS